jgi:hypothetical protein
VEILRQIGIADDSAAAQLMARLEPDILDSRRQPVGRIRPTVPPATT